MKKLVATAVAAAVLATGAIAAPAAAQGETRLERGEARLAELLEGYEQSGEPRNCISALRSHDIRVIPYVGVVYEGGDTIYVARATRPEMLRDTDVPVIERHSGQLCTTDIMRTFDRHSPSFTGVLFLEDFVPYTRVAETPEG
jgi:hypothetical protein